MQFARFIQSIAILIAISAPRAFAAEPTAFPTTPGVSFTLRTTTRQDSKPATTTEQAGSVEAGPTLDKQATLLLNKTMIVAIKPNGYYLLGELGKDNKPALYPEPALMVPIAAKLGDKWVDKRPSGAISSACLGSERVTVPAGTFDAVKVYGVVTVGVNDRTELTFWYAPEVGLVKRTASDQKVDKEGKASITETTDELLSYKLPGEKIAGGAEPDSAKLFAAGEALARAGDHAGALTQYDAALAADPKASKVLAYKAVSLMAQRKFDQAERAIAAALAMNPKEFTYIEISGQNNLAQGQIDAGKALYDRAAELAPESAGAIYLDLAAALAARKEPALAVQVQAALEKSATAKPPHPNALFALGQSYISAGKVEGKAYLQRYLDITAKLPEPQRDAQKIQLAKQLIRAIDAVKGL